MTDVHGTTPLPSAARIWYDPDVVTGEPQQPETTPIAHFESAPNDTCPTGALLDVNASFVVYAVKNGLVRVLDRQSTLRTLLRGHETKVTDVSFFQNGDILGTIGGNLIIWRIFTRESELTAEKLLEIPSDLLNMRHLVWHPFITNQFWLIHSDANDQRVATLVETTRIKASPHETENHAVCQLEGDDIVMEGGVRLQVDSAAGDGDINDLCWSGRDPRHVLTAHADGGIRLWDVKQPGDPMNNDTNPHMCVATIQEDEAVTRCFFLPHDNVVNERGPSITNPFVTATRNNAVITLWSPFGEGGVAPTRLSVFGIENPAAGGYNLATCFGGTPLRDGPPASFLLLSDRSEGKLFCVAMKSKWSPDEPKRAILAGWDYVVPFHIMHPIYSWAIMGAPAENLDEDDEEAAVSGPLFDMNLYSVQSRAVQLLTATHAMCVPPESSWDENDPSNGIRVEPLDSAPMTTVDVTHTDPQFEEDYELDADEMRFEDYNEDAPQESPSQAVEDVEAPASTTQSNNPFANWLGAIVSKTTGPPVAQEQEADEKLPPPPPPPTPKLAPNDAPPGLPKAAPIPPIDAPEPPSPALLSPIQLLQGGKTISDMEHAANTLPKNPDSGSKGEKKKKSNQSKGHSRSPKPPKGNKQNGGKKSNQPAMPVPSMDGKIAILKREDATGPPTTVEPSLDTVPPPPQPPTDLEEVLRKTLATHFKRHESLVTSEIQRTVRAELQSTVLPALSKTLTQNLEQTVVKPLQSAINKASKESTKVRANEVVTAISGSIEAPLKQAFHESMKTAMIPAYEAATRQMFSQISTSLDEGMLTKNQSSAESVMEMSGKLDSISRAMEVLSAEVKQLRSAVSASGNGGSLGGAGVPPVEHPKDKIQAIRDEILTLLKQRSYEAAFTKALSASTAEMAVFCCKNADLSDVLGGSSPALSQPLLLCLMQQLGAVLVSSKESDLQTELAWLQEIALVLDPSCDSIQRHVPGVLQQLVASINTKMAQGDPSLRRPLQMLLQVIRGMQ